MSTSEVHSTRKTGSEYICRNAAPHAVWLVERERGRRVRSTLLHKKRKGGERENALSQLKL